MAVITDHDFEFMANWDKRSITESMFKRACSAPCSKYPHSKLRFTVVEKGSGKLVLTPVSLSKSMERDWQQAMDAEMNAAAATHIFKLDGIAPRDAKILADHGVAVVGDYGGELNSEGERMPDLVACDSKKCSALPPLVTNYDSDKELPNLVADTDEEENQVPRLAFKLEFLS